MSATLGSLALASVMQATGTVATETANVVFVDFVSKTIITEYAAATGTTAAAVEASIAGGVTISTAGVIIISAAALAIIAAIIAWWVSNHTELETENTQVVVESSLGWGDLKISHMYEDGTVTSGSATRTKLLPIGVGTPFTGTIGEKFKINDNLFLECLNKTAGNPNYYFTKADGSRLSDFVVGSYTYIPYLNFTDRQFSPVITPANPAYMSIVSPGISEEPRPYPPIIMTVPTTDSEGKTCYIRSDVRWGGTRRGFTDITQILIEQLNIQSTITQPFVPSQVSQIKRVDSIEIPVLDPSQEVKIDTGSSTVEIPDPSAEEIANHINEQVNNPDADPNKGYNYKPSLEVENIQQPNPNPNPDPEPVPVPEPTPVIPSTPITPPGLPVLGSTSSGMVQLWNPTQAEMQNTANFLLSGDFVDQVIKLFADPADYMLSLSLQPVTPATSAKIQPYVGSLPVPGVTMAPITNQYAEISCGSVTVPATYGSFMDFDSQISIFVPYVGEMQLNVQDVIGSTLTLIYKVDLLTGVCAAMLRVQRNANGVNLDAVLYQWQGNMSAQIPIRASSWNVGITDIAAGAIAGSAGGASGAVAGGAVALGKGMLKPRISGSGSLTGNAGHLGIQQPYLIIARPRQATPSTYSEFSARSSASVASLGAITGYTIIRDIHLSGIPATSDELDEIESLLKAGVML